MAEQKRAMGGRTGAMVKGLSFRIALWVTALAISVALAVSLLFYNRTLGDERAKAREDLVQLGKTVHRSATIAAYLDNAEIAEEVIQGLAQNQVVAGVSLSSLTGMSIQRGTRAEAVGDTGVVRLRLESPFSPDEVVGELLIVPKLALIERNARHAAQQGAMVLAGYTLLVALIITLVIQYSFVGGLKAVAGGLHTIVPGSSQRLNTPPLHRENEIGGLVLDINHLLDTVQLQLDAERGLREQVEAVERRLRMIYERAGVGIALLDTEGQVLMGNPAFRELVASAAAERGVASLPELFQEPALVRQLVLETALEAQPASEDLELAPGPTGKTRWAHCLFTRVRESGGLEGQVYVQAILNDITERKRTEQFIRFQAERDPLTHLLNRRSMERQLDAFLERARGDQTCVAVCLIDLDNFKPINDTYGHEAGDKVLVTTAERMHHNQRGEDLAARFGGDEFLVAHWNVAGRDAMETMARKLIKILTQEIRLDDGHGVTVGVSMGIALSSEHGYDAAHLIALADKAMYQVKNHGKNDFHIHAAPRS